MPNPYAARSLSCTLLLELGERRTRKLVKELKEKVLSSTAQGFTNSADMYSSEIELIKEIAVNLEWRV